MTPIWGLSGKKLKNMTYPKAIPTPARNKPEKYQRVMALHSAANVLKASSETRACQPTFPNSDCWHTDRLGNDDGLNHSISLRCRQSWLGAPLNKTSHLADNQLTSLDVSQNTALRKLFCPGNQIANLDISQNSLSKIYCNKNQLRSLDVSSNKFLTFLDCSVNHLKSLDVSQNSKLENLD